MNITLAIEALSPRLSGIGRYTWELCKRVPYQPGILRVSYVSNGRLVNDPAMELNGPPNSERLRFPKWITAPLHRHFLRTSVTHGPNYFLPPEAETGIITIHDLSVFHYPETHPPERIRHFERDFGSSLDRAIHILTDTETVRRELIAHFGISESNITAVPLGVSDHYRPHSSEELRSRPIGSGLAPGEYALCVSTLEPRKKIAELLCAWRELPANIRNSTPLVLAGADGWLNERLHEQIRDGVAAGWLRYLGFVPEADLALLYAGAKLFLYPSIYEGFGLPPIEAMASGVPVIVANNSCLPEVCGDAALYVDPNDTAGFSATISGAIMDEEWRAIAREKGLKQASGYSWDRCTEQTVQIYREVARVLGRV
jgi:alpha-1,3-rhamnosyl/mannosyltransferase